MLNRTKCVSFDLDESIFMFQNLLKIFIEFLFLFSYIIIVIAIFVIIIIYSKIRLVLKPMLARSLCKGCLW